jgi:hypothetical protein
MQSLAKIIWWRLGLISLGALALWPKTSAGAIIKPSCTGEGVGAGVETIAGTCLPKGSINTVSDIVMTALNVLILIVGLIAIVFVVIGGYRYITASGNDEQIKAAKGTILNALIGLAVVILAAALVRIVASAIVGSV